MMLADITPDTATTPAAVIDLHSPWREAWLFDAIDSTQTYAAERVRAGEDLRGIAIVSEQQLLGHGRSGNAWSSEPGGLYVTAGLPGGHDLPLPYTGWLPMAAALGCADALGGMFGISALLKWPNDVIVRANGREAKIAGLLGEVARPAKPLQGLPTMLIGMGLNWRNTIPAGVQVRFPVTSVVEHFPELNDAGRIGFLTAWLENLSGWHQRVIEQTLPTLKELRRRAERILWRMGESVELERTEQGHVSGRLQGLNELGGAQILRDDGTIINVHCGWQRAE